MIGVGAFILIGLLSFGVTFALLDSEDDEDVVTDPDPDDPDVPDEPDEPVEGESLVISESGTFGVEGSGVYTTGEGDDTITSGADSLSRISISTGEGDDEVNLGTTRVEFSDISTGDGNDSIYVAGGDDELDIDAGDGDDTIYATGYGQNVLGGNGDDVITRVGSLYDDVIDGGAGDDTLNVGTYPSDHSGLATGGEGDDTLNIFASNRTYSYEPTSSVFGGAGADDFNVFFELSLPSETDGTPSDYEDTLTIGDFDPREDTLAIDLSDVDNADFIGARLEDGNLFLDFMRDDGEPQSAMIEVDSEYPFTLSDIQIILGDEDDELEITEDFTNVDTGAGDDTVTGDADDLVIQTGSGSDEVDLEAFASEVDGGTGADTITVEGYGNAIDGGAGDDAIAVIGEGLDVTGGEGDDVISLAGRTVVDETINIDGGDGDDTIVTQFGAVGEDDGISNAGYYANTYLTGGEGADQFELEILEIDPLEDYPGEFSVGMVITDFERGEDLLVIDPYANIPAGSDTSFSAIGTEPTEDGDGTYVIFYYTDDVSGDESQVAIRLDGAAGVSVDNDIRLIGGPDAAPLAMSA